MNEHQDTKIALDYRPETYWGSPESVFANVKGEERRKAIRAAFETGEGTGIPENILADELSPVVRDVASRVDPRNMGGEFLPGYEPGEIEIARIVLASVTQDVMSIRAARTDGRIYYRVVDEYDMAYQTSIQDSDVPLTLRELIQLLDSIETGGVSGSPEAILNSQRPHRTAEEVQDTVDFVRVYSDFYPELESWYAREAAKWAEGEVRLLDD
jgi:hypothetical protein